MLAVDVIRTPAGSEPRLFLIRGKIIQHTLRDRTTISIWKNHPSKINGHVNMGAARNVLLPFVASLAWVWNGVQGFIDAPRVHVPHVNTIHTLPKLKSCSRGNRRIGSTVLFSRKRRDGKHATGMSVLQRARDALLSPAFRQLLVPMAAAGALLGPNLDSYHSAFGVLSYKDPIQVTLGSKILVTTDWW